MAKMNLLAATWTCVNPGAAYASGVEITINIEKSSALLRYEFTDSDTVAPTALDYVTEPVKSLSVKAVDGKGFFWLLSQGADVDVQIETITPISSNPTLVNADQLAVAVTGTAVQLPTVSYTNGLVVKASVNNSSPIFVGDATVNTVDDGTGTGYRLDQGEAVAFGVTNSDAIYINGAAGDFVYITGN